MRRVFQIVVFYAVLAQATGLAWAMAEDACSAQCEDDGAGDRDHCPPNCADCVCSIVVHATSAAPIAVAAIALPAIRVTFVERSDARPSPDPRDILHVPRAPRV